MKDDHVKVKKLLDEGESTTERVKTREELFAKIKGELKVHEAIEEEIIYPALKDYAATKEIVLEHHIEEEEDEMFKQDRQVMDDSELDELGDRMAGRKQQLSRA